MARVQRIAPTEHGKVIGCFELVRGVRDGDPYVSIVLSIPGRDGTLVRSWGAVGRSLEVREAQDMASWVQLSIHHAMIREHGFQDQLPMG